MHQWGVKLKGGRNNVEIGIRPPIRIRFGNMEGRPNEKVSNSEFFTILVIKGNFDVRESKYFYVSNGLKRWTVAYPRRVSADKIRFIFLIYYLLSIKPFIPYAFRGFIKGLLPMTRCKGMSMPEPNYENMELEEMSDKFQKMQTNGVQYMMYIDSKQTRSHGQSKYC